ncbi:membrane protein [Lampropedia cohaerens]|uniref:Membrane protein n=1 Tax=Lampropedia cohaerens TaxID=1610491 RepID=A0A0U1Q271_9BURK|nr:MFS transporter [Lampropedia cohaerens]KKW68847.1 membrane protein [Lampropedia cohaerens]
MASTPTVASGIRRGTSAYWRASLALFCAGYATFSLLYCVQPLLPALAREFQISAATSSLSLSVSTLALAFGLLPAGALAEVVNRKRMMTIALAVASAAALLGAFASHWTLLVATRLALGLALSGLPALAMAYVSEEFERSTLAAAMGLYISGTVLGGMLGRTVTGFLADGLGWRWALGGMGVLAVLALALFVWLLPPARAFQAEAPQLRHLMANFAEHLRNPLLRILYVLGFLLMGCFVALFNYVGFRLEGPPFFLSASQAGLLFLTYLGGVASARMAAPLRGRFGERAALSGAVATMLLGLLLCAASSIWVLTVGVGVFALAFFAAHSMISAQVGATASHAKAQASSLYLSCYYLGSSLIGSGAGLLWQHGGWTGLLIALGFLLLCALTMARHIVRH